MSIFLAPVLKNASETARQYRIASILHAVRMAALLLAFFGALAALLQTFILGFLSQYQLSQQLIDATMGWLNQATLPIWLGLCLGGLSAALIVSLVSTSLATAGGRTLLECMRDDPAERILINLIGQTNSAYIIKDPAFKISGETLRFDLLIVSTQGISLISSTRPSKDYPDLSEFKASLTRLGEQHSLPLLTRLRFLQLWEPKMGVEWQTCLPQDFSRHFQRNDVGAGKQEIAASLRAIYNLLLPSNLSPVPLQGSLPPPGELRQVKQYRLPGQRKSLKIASKGLFVGAVILASLSGGVYALQFVNYEAYERIALPARGVLRKVLPHHWQDRIRLGQDTIYNETTVHATIIANARLSRVLGKAGADALLVKNTEVQIIQAQIHQGLNWYLVRHQGANGFVQGWLPGTVVLPRHIVKRRTPIYARPDARVLPVRYAERDEPVALLMTQTIPTPSGELLHWSKVAFLGQSAMAGSTAYIQAAL